MLYNNIVYIYIGKKKIEQKSFYYNLILLYMFVLLLFQTLWEKVILNRIFYTKHNYIYRQFHLDNIVYVYT